MRRSAVLTVTLSLLASSQAFSASRARPGFGKGALAAGAVALSLAGCDVDKIPVGFSPHAANPPSDLSLAPRSIAIMEGLVGKTPADASAEVEGFYGGHIAPDNESPGLKTVFDRTNNVLGRFYATKGGNQVLLPAGYQRIGGKDGLAVDTSGYRTEDWNASALVKPLNGVPLAKAVDTLRLSGATLEEMVPGRHDLLWVKSRVGANLGVVVLDKGRVYVGGVEPLLPSSPGGLYYKLPIETASK